MWLIDKIKKLFDKSIFLQEGEKENLLTYVKLKGKELKLGQEVNVGEGYALVTVYYNHFCDVVGEGKHKLDETTLPRMYRLFYNAKRKEDEKIPNKIEDADLYFLNLGQMKMGIRTKKIRFVSNEGKVKARLKCEIEYKICDVSKFMEYFAEEFAILKNSKVVGEVEYFLKEKIEAFFERADFDDLFMNKEVVENLILTKLQELKTELGVEVEKFLIGDVEVPKKYLGKKIIAKNKVEARDDIIKMAENSVNGVEEKEKVYVEANNVAGSGQGSGQETNVVNEREANGGNFKQNFQQNSVADSNFQNKFESCEDIIKDVNKSQQSLYGGYGGDCRSTGEEYKISDAPQEAPNLFDEPKKEPIKEESHETKVVTKYKVVVKCPCCGAKNEENAEFCMVCKSKL